MKADQLNERFDKADWDENESHNLHTENAVEIAHAFGTREEIEAMERIADQHQNRGHILPHEIEERSALVKKYYNMLENATNPSVRSKMEGYKIMPPMDSKYVARDGLEGPFTTLSGKVVYYDPKEGKYYDPDTDIYLTYDEFRQYDNDYTGIKGEEADDFIKDIEPKETVKGPRGHLSSIVNADKDIEEGKYKSHAQRKAVHASKADKEKVSEFGPAERYVRTGDTITTANSRTGSIRSTQKVGDTVRSVNNHFNADGSQGQASATTTIGNRKISVNGPIGGGLDKANVTTSTVNASKKNNKKVSELNTISSRQTYNAQDKGGVQKDNYTSHARDYDSKKGLTTHTTAQQFDGSTTDRFVMPGGSGVATKNGVEKNIQMKGPQSWAYDKPKLNASKKSFQEQELAAYKEKK